MKILLTGSHGYIGAVTGRVLVDAGHEVTGLDSYLYAEQATLRKSALKTEEVADAVLFLLSPRSAGINAQSIVIDAGMGTNFFDRGIVRRATRPEEGA